jgi:hypothetical protein
MSDFIPARMKHRFPITKTSKLGLFREIIVILSLHAVGEIQSLVTFEQFVHVMLLSD